MQCGVRPDTTKNFVALKPYSIDERENAKARISEGCGASGSLPYIKHVSDEGGSDMPILELEASHEDSSSGRATGSLQYNLDSHLTV